MRALLPLLLLIATPLLAAPAGAPPDPDAQLAATRAEVARTTAEEQRLTAAASRARDEATRLAAEQQAAAAGIAAAEARIDAAQAALLLATIAEARQRDRLAQGQAPVAGLLAGLVNMGRRPPLLALADGSAEEFVRMRLLLDATMPVIRARTAALAADLAAAQRSRIAAVDAHNELARRRAELEQQRSRFAELEQRALARETVLAGRALGAGDAALAGGEQLASLDDRAARRRAGLAAASELARLDPLPARPTPDSGALPAPPFAYRLPADAAVEAGLGSVDSSGIRSRGLKLATARGTPLRVPAGGTVAFAGPFRQSDGVVIIDHGGGWMSLVVNAATSLPRGTRVAAGDPLGRALGPLEVELSHDGARVSPAFIAASSAMLSNRSQGR